MKLYKIAKKSIQRRAVVAMATEISLSSESKKNIAYSFDILHVTSFSGFPRSVLKLCP